MEYLSEQFHQTHTQFFLYDQGNWSAAPDNCSGLQFGFPGFDELDSCIEWFVGLFTDYLQSVLKEKYEETNLVVKEYTCTFSEGISDGGRLLDDAFLEKITFSVLGS